MRFSKHIVDIPSKSAHRTFLQVKGTPEPFASIITDVWTGACNSRLHYLDAIVASQDPREIMPSAATKAWAMGGADARSQKTQKGTPYFGALAADVAAPPIVLDPLHVSRKVVMITARFIPHLFPIRSVRGWEDAHPENV